MLTIRCFPQYRMQPKRLRLVDRAIGQTIFWEPSNETFIDEPYPVDDVARAGMATIRPAPLPSGQFLAHWRGYWLLARDLAWSRNSRNLLTAVVAVAQSRSEFKRYFYRSFCNTGRVFSGNHRADPAVIYSITTTPFYFSRRYYPTIDVAGIIWGIVSPDLRTVIWWRSPVCSISYLWPHCFCCP